MLFTQQQETYKKTYSSFGRVLIFFFGPKSLFLEEFNFFLSPTNRTTSEQRFPASASFYHFWIIRKTTVLTVSDPCSDNITART